MTGAVRPVENLSPLRHALRTPLNHIIGYAEMLAEDVEFTPAANSPAATSLKEIVTEAQRICDLIQGLGSLTGSTADIEIDRLRALMLPHARSIQQLTADLSELNSDDVDRISSATAELLEFALYAKTPLILPDPRPRGKVAFLGSAVPLGRLLVVDDDEANRDILRRHLERQGYQILLAASVPEALRILTSEDLDAVLLDLVMPGMSGFDLLDKIKQHRHLSHLPVLVISASDDLESVAESLHRGAEDYLVKPFNPALLSARLSATLERKRLRDQERLKNAELERLTEAMKRSNEDLKRFAYAASHDLQAPVRTITTYIQLLQRRVKSRLTEDEQEMFGFAEGAAKRMHVLIHDLLQYSQATTSESLLVPVDTNQVVDSLLLDMESETHEAGAVVTHDQLPTLVCDGTRLRQIFQNLIGNAIKYRSAAPPRVHISAASEPGNIRFGVEDNGEGIPHQHLDRIFEMFQRLHGDSVPGSGIGLAICKRLVERAGGRIWVESEPDHGSTFYFTLPVPTE